MPPEEAIHGTAAGDDPPTAYASGEPLQPGDIPRPRVWDLPVWLDGDETPSVQMLSPQPIPGLDPNVGVSPPPSWPDPPYPAFYYPSVAGVTADRLRMAIGRACRDEPPPEPDTSGRSGGGGERESP